MDLNKRVQDIDSRWSFSPGYVHEAEFDRFKCRIIDLFSKIDNHISRKDISDFCAAMKIKEEWIPAWTGHDAFSFNIINALEGENDPKKFFRLIEIILNLDIKCSSISFHDVEFSKEFLVEKTEYAINSSNVAAQMTIEDGEVFLHPAFDVVP